MIYYFIENYQGEWLRDIEDPDTSMWTTDPTRAWSFSGTGMYFLDTSNHNSRLTPWQADDIISFLQEENSDIQLVCTEHERKEDEVTWKHWVQPHLRTGPGITEWRYMYYLGELNIKMFGNIINGLTND